MNSSQACIAIDVSKGKSHVCAYSTKDTLIQKPIEILHDREGFKVLDDLYNRLNKEKENPPTFIYETTGIYHRPLKRYLKDKHYPQSEISPLLAANIERIAEYEFLRVISRILSLWQDCFMMAIFPSILNRMNYIMNYFN